MLSSKRDNNFNNSEVHAMSQIIAIANQRRHTNSKGERIDDHCKVSGSTGVVKGWDRKSIDKIIEFLRKEAIIKIHRESLEVIDGHSNASYEITLTIKGKQLAVDRHAFSDYYRYYKSKEDKEELGVREKRFNIFIPIVSLAVSTLISIYTLCIGSDTEDRVNKLSIMIDSLSRDLILSKAKIDSLATLRGFSVDSIRRTSKSANGVGKYSAPQLKKL